MLSDRAANAAGGKGENAVANSQAYLSQKSSNLGYRVPPPPANGCGSKWNPIGKWSQGLKPAVPWWLNFDPYPSGTFSQAGSVSDALVGQGKPKGQQPYFEKLPNGFRVELCFPFEAAPQRICFVLLHQKLRSELRRSELSMCGRRQMRQTGIGC